MAFNVGSFGIGAAVGFVVGLLAAFVIMPFIVTARGKKKENKEDADGKNASLPAQHMSKREMASTSKDYMAPANSTHSHQTSHCVHINILVDDVTMPAGQGYSQWAGTPMQSGDWAGSVRAITPIQFGSLAGPVRTCSPTQSRDWAGSVRASTLIQSESLADSFRAGTPIQSGDWAGPVRASTSIQSGSLAGSVRASTPIQPHPVQSGTPSSGLRPTNVAAIAAGTDSPLASSALVGTPPEIRSNNVAGDVSYNVPDVVSYKAADVVSYNVAELDNYVAEVVSYKADDVVSYNVTELDNNVAEVVSYKAADVVSYSEAELNNDVAEVVSYKEADVISYSEAELDDDWKMLLEEVDELLLAAGHGAMSSHERTLAVRKLIVATGSRGEAAAQFALNKARDEVIWVRSRAGK
eukprot:gene226-3994_t